MAGGTAVFSICFALFALLSARLGSAWLFNSAADDETLPHFFSGWLPYPTLPYPPYLFLPTYLSISSAWPRKKKEHEQEEAGAEGRAGVGTACTLLTYISFFFFWGFWCLSLLYLCILCLLCPCI